MQIRCFWFSRASLRAPPCIFPPLTAPYPPRLLSHRCKGGRVRIRAAQAVPPCARCPHPRAYPLFPQGHVRDGERSQNFTSPPSHSPQRAFPLLFSIFPREELPSWCTPWRGTTEPGPQLPPLPVRGGRFARPCTRGGSTAFRAAWPRAQLLQDEAAGEQDPSARVSCSQAP